MRVVQHAQAPLETRLPLEWLMENLDRRNTALLCRVAEVVAVSVWFFAGPPLGDAGGGWLDRAAEEIAAELKRRGVDRSPSALLRYREDIDCDGHLLAVRARQPHQSVRAAHDRMRELGQRPVEPPPPGRRRLIQPQKQRFYERGWPTAEEHLKGQIAHGCNQRDAAWLTVELVLDAAATAPPGMSAKQKNIEARRTPIPSDWSIPEKNQKSGIDDTP